MGLLSKVFGGTAKKATDDVLLLHSMMLMAGADGILEGAELVTLEAFLNTLPEFRGTDLNSQFAQANKLAAKFPKYKDSVKALSDISSEAIRKKAFILAADIALSSGDIDETEEELLESMQRVLNVDDALATKIIEVLALKYAS